VGRRQSVVCKYRQIQMHHISNMAKPKKHRQLKTIHEQAIYPTALRCGRYNDAFACVALASSNP